MPAKPATTFSLDEDRAREVLMVQAFEAGSDSTALWTAEDRAWATRLARDTTPAGSSDADFIAERARHALMRLAPREPALKRGLGPGLWQPRWYLVAALVGLVSGALIDQIGAAQRINLLAPPLWGLVGWNLLVYLWLLSRLLRLRMSPTLTLVSLRRQLQRLWSAPAGASAPMASFAASWSRLAAKLNLARAGSLLHIAAAALGLGLMLGLYLRGLVLDYRAGWQSTFLDAAQVQALLNLLLEPAHRLSGLPVPDATGLRVTPEVPANGAAAPWIHLYATTLMAAVVLPRLLLAAASLWRARRCSQGLVLPWGDAYFERLRRARAGAAALVQVWPHGAAPSAQAALGLQALLATELGGAMPLRLEDATAYGDEDATPARATGATAVALFDLASTPEPESQGRFITQLMQGGTLIVVTNESAFARRFAAMPERLAQRREAWRGFCAERGAGWLSADLESSV